MPRPWTDDAISRLKREIGDLDDARLTMILALDPTYEEVVEAAALAAGDPESLEQREWPLSGKVGEIFEILTADIEDESRLH